jgi:molybdopterin synthase catalytic subunit
MRVLAITPLTLFVEALIHEVESIQRPRGEGCGAIATFVGVVRATHQHRRVTHLVYEAFDTLAERVFRQIQAEVADTWPTATLAIQHRVGRLEIGEASVVIAAAAPHREAAFQVCRYAIERVKQVAPIWKHEFFEDGEAWVEGALADPDDEVARLTAHQRACR